MQRGSWFSHSLLLGRSADSMSAFQSRGDSRSGRGRGRPRGNSKLRDFKTEMNTFNGQRTPSSTSASNSLSTQSKPPPKQPRVRNKQWRNSNATSTPSRNSASNLTRDSTSETLKVRDQSWRDPANEPSSSYQKHMSELYQQVSAPLPRYWPKNEHSDFLHSFCQ